MNTRFFYGLALSISMIAFGAASYGLTVDPQNTKIVENTRTKQMNDIAEAIDNSILEFAKISQGEYNAYSKYAKEITREKSAQRQKYKQNNEKLIKAKNEYNNLQEQRNTLSRANDKDTKKKYNRLKEKIELVKRHIRNIYNIISKSQKHVEEKGVKNDFETRYAQYYKNVQTILKDLHEFDNTLGTLTSNKSEDAILQNPIKIISDLAKLRSAWEKKRFAFDGNGNTNKLQRIYTELAENMGFTIDSQRSGRGKRPLPNLPFGSVQKSTKKSESQENTRPISMPARMGAYVITQKVERNNKGPEFQQTQTLGLPEVVKGNVPPPPAVQTNANAASEKDVPQQIPPKPILVGNGTVPPPPEIAPGNVSPIPAVQTKSRAPVRNAAISTRQGVAQEKSLLDQITKVKLRKVTENTPRTPVVARKASANATKATAEVIRKQTVENIVRDILDASKTQGAALNEALAQYNALPEQDKKLIDNRSLLNIQTIIRRQNMHLDDSTDDSTEESEEWSD